MDPTNASPAAAPAAASDVSLEERIQRAATTAKRLVTPEPPPLDLGPSPLANTAPATAPVNQAAAIVAQDLTQERDLTAGALRFKAEHRDLAPEKAAEIISYSIASRRPAQDVEQDLPGVKQLVDNAGVDWNRLSRETPALARFMLDRHGGAVVQDDVAGASAIEWALTAPFHVLADSVREQETVGRQFAEFSGSGSPQNRERIGELEGTLGAKDYGARSILGRAWLAPAKMAVPILGDLAARTVGGAAFTLLGGAGGAAAGAPAAGAGAAPGAVGGASAALFASQFLASGLFNAYESAGPLYWEAVKQGVPQDVARAVATGGAIANGLLGAGLLGKVGAAVPGVRSLLNEVGATAIRKAMSGSSAAMVKEALKAYGEHVVAGASLMGALNAVNSASVEAGKSLGGLEAQWGNVPRAAADGFVTGLNDMLLLAATGPGRDLLHDLGRSRAGAEGSARLAALVGAAEQSKLLQRSPTAFEAFIRKVKGEKGAVQDVLVPVEEFQSFAQGAKLDAGELAAQLVGDGGKAYAEALATKGDLAIPVEKFLSQLAQGGKARTLLDDAKIDVNDLTARQRKAAAKDLQAKIDSAAKLEPDAMEAGQREVYDDWAQKAKAAGRPNAEADGTARLVSAVFHTWAQQLSAAHPDSPVTAGELYRQRALVQIVAGDPKGPGTRAPGALDQPGFHGTWASGIKRFDLSKVGTGTGLSAEGWGVYLTSEKGIADAYRQRGITAKSFETGQGFEGGLYRAELPEDTELLQLRESISKQPDQVRAALERAGVLKDGQVQTSGGPKAAAEISGKDLYLDLSRQWREKSGVMKGIEARREDEAASRFLDAAGVHGATYPGELGYGDKRASNFVIWNADAAKELAAVKPEAPPQVLPHVAPIAEGGQFEVFFQPGVAQERGRIAFTPFEGGKPQSFQIELFRADRSTLAHETAHFLGEVLGNLAGAKDAPTELRADYEALLRFMGHGTHEERQRAAGERRSLEKLTQRTAEQEARLTELTAREERLSHAWEVYLSEGRAPAPELAGVFARFRGWMLRIYDTLKGVEGQFRERFGEDLGMTDDVRRVFDRMLAGEDALRRAEGDLGALELPPELQHMTTADREKYLKTRTAAREEAERGLLGRISSLQERELTKDLQEQRARLQAEVEKDLDGNRTYRALRALQTGESDGSPADRAAVELLKGPDGRPLRLDRKEFVQRYGAEAARDLEAKHRGIFAPLKQGGADLESAAGLLQFDSADEMVKAFQGAMRRETFVEDEVQRRVEELYGPSILKDQQRLGEEALAAAANEKQLTAVLQLLHAAARKVSPFEAAKAQEVSLDTVRARAARILEGKMVRELSPDRHFTAYRAAGKRALEWAGKDRWDKVGEERLAQLVNLELYRQTRDLRDEMEAGLERVERTDGDASRGKLGLAGPAYRDAHDAIMEALGIAQGDWRSGDQRFRVEIFEGLVRKAAEDDVDLDFDHGQLRELLITPKPWSLLTVEEARNVRDAVENIRHVAARLNQVKADNLDVERTVFFTEVDRKAAESVPRQAPMPRDQDLETRLQKAGKLVSSFDGKLLTLETMVDFLTGGDRDSALWKAVIGGELACRKKKDDLAKRFQGVILEKWEKLPAELQKLRDEKVDVSQDLPLLDSQKDLLDGPVTRSHLWMVALNLGNDGNEQRLLDGFGWVRPQVMEVLQKHLTRAEWDWVQGVWDALEDLAPEIDRVQQLETGLKLKRVKPVPFEATTSDGQVVQLRGGYFPAVYDPRLAALGVRQEESVASMMDSPSYVRAATAKGHTKGRAERFESALNLRWSVVPGHVAQVIHDVSYRSWVRQTAQIFLDPRMQRTLKLYLGEGRAGEFVPWLKSVANAQADAAPTHMRPVDNVLSFLRNRVAVSAIGHSLSTAMGDLTNPLFAAASGDVSLGSLTQAFTKFVASPREMRAFALENSPELQHRTEAATKALRDQLQEMSARKPNPALKAVQDSAWVFMEATDKLTSTPIWLAKYQQELGRGLTHEAAVREADATIRKHFPAGEAAGQPSILRDRRGVGSMFMFYGFMNRVYNVNRSLVHDAWVTWQDPEASAGDKAGATAAAAGRLLAVAMVTGAMSEFLSGRGKEDDESWEQWLMRKTLVAPFTTVPLVGQALEAGVAGKKVNIRQAPAAAALQQAFGTAQKLGGLVTGKTSADAKLAWDLVEALGLAAGVPVRQERKTLEYLTTGSPSSPGLAGAAEIAGGLVYGERKNQPDNPGTAVADLLK
jgi:hypothetical protein